MSPSPDSMRVQRVALPMGPAGTDATIQAMAKAAMGEYGAGSIKIISLAHEIIKRAGVAERDKYGEMVAIHNFVMQHLRYVSDPLWYEMITYPETLAFESQTGDCDDHVVLEAALLAALGIQSRYVTFAQKNAAIMDHVALEARIKNDWVSLDPIIKNKPAGWRIPTFKNMVQYGVNTPNGAATKVFSLANASATVLTIVSIGLFWWWSHRSSRSSRKNK